MGKRAAPAAKAPAKKMKVEAPVDVAFASVGDAVMESEQVPERVRAMLVEMLPFSLKFGSDERHELQELALGMVEETLSGKKHALESNATSEESALATLKASESQLGINVTEAEASLASQKDVVQAAKTALAEATAAQSDSMTTLTNKRTEQSGAADKLTKMQEEKAAIESAFAEHFAPMQEGGTAGKAHLKKLEPFLKKIEIESTLLTALPSTCAKSNDKRGTFDHLVLEELQKAFNATIASLGASIVGEGPAAVERQAGVAAAEQDERTKDAAKTKATGEFEAAEKEQSDREAALSAAKQAVEDFVPQVEAVTTQLADARSASVMFEAGPFANFHTYKARVAALPVTEEAAAEEAPAEEAAAEVSAAA